MRAPSILQTEKECYFTGATNNLEAHHIFYGSGLRNVSENNGFWVWLTADSHRGTCGVHGKHGERASLLLKQECQRKFEETHSREEFRKLIGRSYL